MIKKILEYVEIVGTELKSLIHDNEGHSNNLVLKPKKMVAFLGVKIR